MNVTDDRLALWARPLSETEDTKCTNACEQVTSVMRNQFGNDVRVFIQGSYANRTNVRQDSDVDIVVVHTGFYFPDTSFLPREQEQLYWSNFTSSIYTFDQFRREVHAVLNTTFPLMIEPKEKCLKVRGNTNRVNADVVPAFEHYRLSSHTAIQHKGIAFNTLSGEKVVSFPDQHYKNGVAKNDRTGRTYKQVVRILKNVRHALIENGTIDQKLVSSYFIECLVWNVSDDFFVGTSLRDITRNVIRKIWNDMRESSIGNNYAEICDLHWLLRGPTKTPAQAELFALKAWNYLAP